MGVNDEDRTLRLLEQKVEEMRRVREPSILITGKASQGISAPGGRLGIFPASFNPPTKAHVALIREARRKGKLDEILVLLDLQAVDKKIFGAPLEHRLFMLKILFRRDPLISIGLSNRSRFVEKVPPIKNLYPPATTFLFIAGFDTLLRIIDRKYYQDRDRELHVLFNQSQLLVANRDDQNRDSFDTLFERAENSSYKHRITFFTLPRRLSFLSSSGIRKEISGGLSVEDQVPPSVLRYIEKTGLYRQKSKRVKKRDGCGRRA